MKKVAALLASNKFGGAEIIFSDLCENLKFNKVIVNREVRDKMNINSTVNINFIQIERKLSSIFKYLFFLPITMARLRKNLRGMDKVFVNDFQGLLLLFFFSRINTLEVVYHCHTAFKVNFLNKWIVGRIINTTTQTIIVPSHYLERELNKLGINNLHVIYNGIKKPKCSPVIKSSQMCKVAMFGAVSDQKGQDVLMKSLKTLRTVFQIKLQAHIAGYILDKEYANQIIESKEAKEGSIIYHGTLSHEEVINMMNEMDIILCLSKYRETLPTVLIEAMSLKKALIGVNVGGICELVTDDVNGRLIPPNDPNELAVSIKEIIDGELLNIYGNNGYLLFKQKFQHKHFLEKIRILIFNEPVKK